MIIVNERNLSVVTIQKDSTSCGNPDAFSFPDFRICFVMHGSAIWSINGRELNIAKGDIIFLSNSQKRRFVKFGKDGFSFAAFCLERSAFLNLHHFLFFINCIKIHNGVMKCNSLCRYLHKIYNELQSSNHLHYEMISAMFTEFFISLERQTGFTSDKSAYFNETLEDILNYIDSNITENLTLSHLAKRAGLTEPSFSRWFAKVNGISFKKYIMVKRISLAVSLIQTTDLKMVDIALECGFESISGFYDAFKKITGTTPSGIKNTGGI